MKILGIVAVATVGIAVVAIVMAKRRQGGLS